MKKILIIIILGLFGFTSYAQLPNNIWNGNTSTLTGDNGMRGFGLGSQYRTNWIDTASLNVYAGGILKNIAGGRYRVVNDIWMRSNDLQSWILQTGSSGSSGWELTGNAGTDSATNFIGTTDYMPLMFKVNGTRFGVIDPTSSIGFGQNTLVVNEGTNNYTLGGNALKANTTGLGNIAIGASAATANISGQYNVVMGHTALITSTTASQNVAIGYQALRLNTADLNTAVGTSTLTKNTSETGNTAVGSLALQHLTTGINNVAVGSAALSDPLNTASFNTAIGYDALGQNTTGYGQVAVGVNVLHNNTIGIKNTGVGSGALEANVDGSFNDAHGQDNQYQATTGSYNVSVGYEGMNNRSTGSNNVGVGYRNFGRGTTGTHNTFIGNEAGSLNPLQKVDAIRSIGIGDQSYTTEDSVVSFSHYIKKTYLRGQLKDSSYGVGTYTGTPATYPAFNSSGDIIESTTPYGSSNFWGLTGNAGTTAGTNFLGTTDGIGLMFKTNSVQSGYLDVLENNTSFGVGSMASRTNGSFNTGMGRFSLTALTSGTNNTGFGESSLGANTIGTLNTAVGAQAIETNISGSENTAVGASSLGLITGSGNIGVGTYAGKNAGAESSLLFISSINHSTFAQDTSRSIIFGVQDATASDQRLRLNSRIFADYLPSGVGDKSVRWNSTTKEFTYADTTATGGGGANTALSNLASVAINTTLVSDADNTDDLGTTSASWKDIYTRTVKFDGSTSGTATIAAPAVAASPTLTLPIVTGTITAWVETTTASSATPTPTGDARQNVFTVTALATAPTFAAPSGTAVNGNTILIRIKDDGTARSILWNAIYRGGTDIALPSTTTLSKTMYCNFVYNSADTKWDLVGLTDGI